MVNDIGIMLNPQSANAENTAKWISEHMDARTDPASKTPGAPPLYGQDAVPHLLTFQSIVGSFSRAYVNPDEAMRDSIENAHLMEKDVGLLESVECRQRLTALLDWEIKPEDEKCQYQVSLAQELQRIISRIRHFTKYRMWLMKAIWSGRSGIQHKYGYTRVNGSMRMMPTPLHRDHNGWMPVNGDKLIFRYEDGMNYTDEGAYPHQMGIKVGTNPGNKDLRIHRKYKLDPVADGMALFLKPYERDTFCVHKHFIEDADFHHSFFAGSVHGVGIRSKIYWEWFLKQEAFAFLMQYLERSAGGIEVWTYPMGDPKALAATQKAAREKMANGRNIVFFPKPMGDDSESYKFEVIEPGAMGLDIMQNIIENYFGGRLKRYILGQELSTEAKATGMGSGVAEAHMDTLSQIVQFDASNLEETLTHELVRYIQQLNFPETLGWHMRMSLKTEDDKTQERMEALNSAYQMGASIAESEVFKTLGLSAPAAGEKILSISSQQQPGMGGMPPGMDQMAAMMGGDPSQMVGDPAQDDSGGMDPEMGGDIPDGDYGDSADDSGSEDPMELIKSLMNQYVAERDRDQYAAQLGFNWNETQHARESSAHGTKRPGEFAPKNEGIFGKTPSTHRELPTVSQHGNFVKSKTEDESRRERIFEIARGQKPAPKSPRPQPKNVPDKIRSLFAEHVANHESQNPAQLPPQATPIAPELPPQATPIAPELPTEPAAQPAPPQPAPPRRRMAGQGADAQAVAAPAAPPVMKTQPDSLQNVDPVTSGHPEPPAVSEKQGNVSAEPASGHDPDTSGQHVDPDDTSFGQPLGTPLTDRQRKLVEDNFHLVQVALRMTRKIRKAGSEDDAESAAMAGLMRAAQKWNGTTDFEVYGKDGACQAIKNLNPKRRKLNALITSGSSSPDDEGDPLANVAERDRGDAAEAGSRAEKLHKALSGLPEHERWLFENWHSAGLNTDGTEMTREHITNAYNDRFSHTNKNGQPTDRTNLNHRVNKIGEKLRATLGPDMYAVVRDFVMRYYRHELLELQKERYERRQDRAIREAAEYTETDPSDAQIKAGNYKKGRFSWNGMQIVIENPRGSTRRGVSSSGEIWKNEMSSHYGYISRTNGNDSDPIDVFMGRQPESDVVFVVHQIDQKTGELDEHKCLLGYVNQKQAKAAYLSHYPSGWKCGEIVPMTVSDFKTWLEDEGCCT